MDKHRDQPRLPRMERLPPARVPVYYFAFAHLSLVLALAAVTFEPAGFAGFFYHPHALAVVHLITLGWISGSILGALYVVGPLALRLPMPTTRRDTIAFAIFAIGTAGMVGHLWIGEYSGVVWSAIVVIVGLAFVAGKVLRGLWPAPIEPPVKMHIALAFFNLLGAGAFGGLLGMDKLDPLVAGEPLSKVYAHAHLAALGWAIMMVMGIGYRLLPMLLPSAVPAGGTLYVSGILLEIGVLGLFWSFLNGNLFLPLFALAATAAFVAFLLHVLWMRRNPRRPPPALVRPDYGVRHAMQSILYGGLGAAIGLALAPAPRSEATLRYAAVYGMIGLIAFLAQMVIGVEARILPIFVSIRARLESDRCGPAPNPHTMIDRRLQAAAFYCWTCGIPVLGIGLGLSKVSLVGTGAGLLLVGAILAGMNTTIVLRRASGRIEDTGTGFSHRPGPTH